MVTLLKRIDLWTFFISTVSCDTRTRAKFYSTLLYDETHSQKVDIPCTKVLTGYKTSAQRCRERERESCLYKEIPLIILNTDCITA